MELKIQIYSLIVSFLYGILFFIMLDLNSRYIYASYIYIKIIISFLFILDMSLLYFIILLYINNGYIHFYFFLCIIIGYIVCKVIKKKIVKR